MTAIPFRLRLAQVLAGRPVTLTITAVTVEQLHNPRTHRPETKAILDFGRSKRLPLNRTQCLALAALAGSEHGPARHAFADWPGLRITLHLSCPQDRHRRQRHARSRPGPSPHHRVGRHSAGNAHPLRMKSPADGIPPPAGALIPKIPPIPRIPVQTSARRIPHRAGASQPAV